MRIVESEEYMVCEHDMHMYVCVTVCPEANKERFCASAQHLPKRIINDTRYYNNDKVINV